MAKPVLVQMFNKGNSGLFFYAAAEQRVIYA